MLALARAVGLAVRRPLLDRAHSYAARPRDAFLRDAEVGERMVVYEDLRNPLSKLPRCDAARALGQFRFANVTRF